MQNQNTGFSGTFYFRLSDDCDIIKKKTEAGYIQVSSPALTAFDLVHYHKKTGGINRIIPILEELADGIKPSELNRSAKNQKLPVLQRLGYLLEQLGDEQLSSTLHKRIANKPLRKIPISLAHKSREGEVNSKWSVILNTELDF